MTLATKLILISLHEEMDTLQINLANLKSVDKQENSNKSSELADSDSLKSKAAWITKTFKENDFQQRVTQSSLPSFTMLSEVLGAEEQLTKFCDNPTFVKEFSLNGGLSLLTQIISGENIHDVRKIVLASIKIFLTLAEIVKDSDSHKRILHDACHDMLGALPGLLKMTSDSDELVQLASYTLINLVFEHADEETGNMIIEKLRDADTTTSNLLETITASEGNLVSSAIIKQVENIEKRTKSTGTHRNIQSDTNMMLEDCKSGQKLLASLEKGKTIPKMAEFVMCLKHIQMNSDQGPGLPRSDKNVNEIRVFHTFLEALINHGISPDQEKIEVHVVGREKFTNLFEGVNKVEEQYCEGGSRVTHFTNTGTFLIATDCDAEGEGVDDATVYHNLVGNFINGIERVTSATGVKSRIAVVTTKQEAEENPRQLNHLLEATKAHISFLKANTVYTSSPDVMKDLEWIKAFSQDSIITKLFRCRPYPWQKLVEEMRRHLFVTVDEAMAMLQRATEDVNVKVNRSETETEFLRKMKETFIMGILAENVTRDLYHPYQDKTREHFEVVMDFLQDKGEILWFKKAERLKGFIITQPEKLTRIVSGLMNMKNIQEVESAHFDDLAKDILSRKGLISYQAFTSIHSELKREGDFSVDKVWDILAGLGLICPLKSDPERYGFIPSLISSRTGEKMLRDRVAMNKNPDSVCLQFVCPKKRETQGMYFNFLKDFSQAFLWGEMGGEITLAFYRRMQDRPLGAVGGVQGVLRWHEEGVQEPQEYRFLILEWEGTLQSPYLEEDPYSNSFAKHRAVQIHLMPRQGDMTTSVLEILSKVNDVVSPSIGSVRRLLSCKPCQMSGKPGFFELREDLHLVSEYDECSELEHTPNQEKILRLRNDLTKEKPFKLASLMKMPKESLELEQFQSSKLKKMMWRGQLNIGEQIWIHHDPISDPFNPVALMKPYAHVVVYVGPTEVKGEVIHEVVHVSKKKMLCGFAKASIVREDVMNVIKPHEQVFLGHKINKVQSTLSEQSSTY